MLALFSRAIHHYGGHVEPPTLSFVDRVILAYIAFFRILFDGAFASRVAFVKERLPELPAATPAKAIRKSIDPPPKQEKIDTAAIRARARVDGALWLLGALQREGRFVDFLEGDVSTFKDDDIGAAARVVHAGCKRAIEGALKVEPIRDESEGAKVTLEEGFKAAENKLTGNVKGEAPFHGVLKHKGWRAKDVKLPTPTKGDEPSVLAPAEIEL